MSQNPLLQQLVSPLVVTKEDMRDPEKAAKKLQVIYDTLGSAFQRLQNLVNTDPRMSDTRIAHGLTTQQGDVIFDYATMPLEGDVLYAATLGGGRRAVWGSGGTGSPTDPGTGPNVGSPHPLLDANQNNDTVAQAPTRGSLIYGNSTPKWDELVKPSVRSVLLNDATDAVYVATPTRTRWLPAQLWTTDAGSLPATAVYRATYPANYYAWEFPTAATAGIQTNFIVPDDWRTGNITFKVWWMTAAATVTNWVPYLYYKEFAAGGDYSAAGTKITGPTTSANTANHILGQTTIGTATTSAAGDVMRLLFERAPGGADTCLGSIYVIGIEANYTPLY